MSIDVQPYGSVPPEAAMARWPDEAQDGSPGLPLPPVPAWRRYLSAVLRQKWPILLLTGVGTGVGVAAARFVSLEYRAHATLWIEVTDRANAARGPIQTGELLQSYAWVELLKSFTILDYPIRELRLYVRPTDPQDASALASLSLADRYRSGAYRITVDPTGLNWVLATRDGVEIERGRVGEPVGGKVGLVWAPPAAELRPGRRIDFEVKNIRDLATALSEGLEAQMMDQGHFLRLSLTGSNARETAETLNAVTKRFVSVASQLKRAKLDELTAVLSDQVRYAEHNLREAERALESYRIRTITLPSERSAPVAAGLQLTRDPVFASFFELKIQRENLRSDREALERISEQIRDSALTVDALAAISAVQGSIGLVRALEESATKRAELRSLLQRYTDSYGSVQRLQGEIANLEQSVIPALTSQLENQLVARERLLDTRIGAASVELEQIPPRAIEEARLQRRVQVAGDLHAVLRQRHEEARLAAASSIPDVRVLDPAVVPDSPTSDMRPIIILIALLGSLGTGVLGAILRERLDFRVRYPEQISLDMGLPVLGTVPRVSEHSEDHEHAFSVEAFRELRLAIVHAHGTAGPVLLTVSSPESGDGKTFVVSNLARAFAQRGDRTLVIDGDVRRGTLHRILGTSRRPGLTDFLAGDVPARQIVQSTEIPNLWTIASGTRMQRAPELLGSSQFVQLVQTLRGAFDVILLDSPPLGAGVDPYILATVTQNLLLVLRTGMSDRVFAAAKLGAMDRLPVRVLGAVLNGFVPTKMHRSYAYLPGYHADDEGTAVVEAVAGSAS